MTDTTLNCLVLGEDPDIKTFDLDIARSKTINKLKEAIKEKIQLDYTAKDLTLWKVDISLDVPNDQLTALRGNLANINLADHLNGIQLHPAQPISFYFTNQPAVMRLSVVIELPTAAPQAPHEEIPKITLSSGQIDEAVKALIYKIADVHISHTVNMVEVKNYQKIALGNFCPTNPLPYGINAKSLNLPMLGNVLQNRDPTPRLGIKRTFSECVQDDVGAHPSHYVIAMVARSGSGKTSTVIALAKKHFVIYVMCAYRGSLSPDFTDFNFATLAEEVRIMCEILRKKFDRLTLDSILKYDRVLKDKAMDRVELEFLARFMFLLLLFDKNPQLEPQDFFREQINGGYKTIGLLVKELKAYNSVTIQEMRFYVHLELGKHLNGRGIVIALDEAHAAENYILPHELISPTGLKDLQDGQKNEDDIFDFNKLIARSEYRRGFLTPLCAALSNINVTLVVLGTAFSLLNADHVYSASSKPTERFIRITNFSLANEDDVSMILQSLLDMSGCDIPKQKRQRLAGRFRFTTYIVEAITKVAFPETKSKQQILDEAISAAESRAKGDAKSTVRKLLQRNGDQNAHLLCQLLIAFKMKNGQITFPQEEHADFVNHSLCVLIEEDNEKYSFTLTEPIIAEAVEEVLKESNIVAEFSECLEQFNSTIVTHGITSPYKGVLFEEISGEILKCYTGKLIEDLPFVQDIKNILPAWCKTTKLRVEKIRRNGSLKEDIDFFKNPSDGEGIYPHHETRPDFTSRLHKELKYGQSGQPPEEIEYWLSFASKLQINPVDSSTNISNTLSSDIRQCFSKTDGTPNAQLKKYRQKFENLGYPSKIKGILRIHFVFPSVARGTPANTVFGEDVLVYIDIKNMDTFFDESITERAKDIRIAKKMLRYLMSSKEELDQLKKQKCRCKSGCINNSCSCRKNGRNCTEWCLCEASCKNP